MARRSGRWTGPRERPEANKLITGITVATTGKRRVHPNDEWCWPVQYRVHRDAANGVTATLLNPSSVGTGVYRVINPKDTTYAGGVKADAVYRYDASITSGQRALTLAGTPTAAFTSADVGKTVMIAGAGAAGIDLITTISAYVSASHVTTTAAASATVSGVEAIYGTRHVRGRPCSTRLLGGRADHRPPNGESRSQRRVDLCRAVRVRRDIRLLLCWRRHQRLDARPAHRLGSLLRDGCWYEDRERRLLPPLGRRRIASRVDADRRQHGQQPLRSCRELLHLRLVDGVEGTHINRVRGA